MYGPIGRQAWYADSQTIAFSLSGAARNALGYNFSISYNFFKLTVYKYINILFFR